MAEARNRRREGDGGSGVSGGREMKRFLSRVVFALEMAAFGVLLLLAVPVKLHDIGVDAIRDRMEARWPDSERVRTISFLFGLLAPLLTSTVLVFAVVWIRELRASKR